MYAPVNHAAASSVAFLGPQPVDSSLSTRNRFGPPLWLVWDNGNHVDSNLMNDQHAARYGWLLRNFSHNTYKAHHVNNGSGGLQRLHQWKMES